MTRFAVALVLLPAWCGSLAAEPHGEKPVVLALRPAPEPVPALRYLLLPELADQVPGNAAVVYHRALALKAAARLERDLDDRIERWLELPLAEVPREEVRKALASYEPILRELALAARHRYCDWQLDFRDEGFSMTLYEFQALRQLARPLALRARLEILDGKLDEALGTLRAGLALARHVAQGPTLIQSLVGIAFAATMAQRLEELIQQPGAPNLYWALTALPTPLIDLSPGWQGEKVLPFRKEVPRLRDLEAAPLTSAQVEQRLEESIKLLSLADGSDTPAWQRRLALLALVLKTYPEAKRDLIARGRPTDQVEAMPALQVVAIYSLRQYERFRDAMFRWMHVPYWQAREPLRAVEQELGTLKRQYAEGIPFASLLLPATSRVHLAGARNERRFALLRCIEALRLHAAAQGGKLPATLGEVTAVPLPNDPLTGKPFEYRRDGEGALLSGAAPPGETAPGNSVLYRLVMKP